MDVPNFQSRRDPWEYRFEPPELLNLLYGPSYPGHEEHNAPASHRYISSKYPTLQHEIDEIDELEEEYANQVRQAGSVRERRNVVQLRQGRVATRDGGP